MIIRAATLMVMLVAGAAQAWAAAEPDQQWIVVTGSAFEAALEPLCDYRRAEGMRVRVVLTTDVLTEEQIRGGEANALVERVHQLCNGFEGTNYVLLVGAAVVNGPDVDLRTVAPAPRSAVGRMDGAPSDNVYGCAEGGLEPTVAVGRFPARTAADVRQMVAKTLAFERDDAPRSWRNRLTVLVGHPGGETAFEKQMAGSFAQQVTTARLGRVAPAWTGRVIIHASGSPFNVSRERLDATALAYLQEGQMFWFYLGHSGASGCTSDGVGMLGREALASLKIRRGRGVFITCGCNGVQLEGPDGEGYGLAAMRNPDGPIAVFGAHGESYAAMGLLVLEGLFDRVNKFEGEQRVGDHWLAAKRGIARGAMDAMTFQMYDQFDGSGGTVPLKDQRLEHLEMWMLLGDPAARLPVQPTVIRMDSDAAAAPDGVITVSGTVPAEFAEAAVRLTLERPLGSAPIGLAPLPADPAKVAEVMMANHQRANDVVLDTYEVRASDGRFEFDMRLPAELPWRQLTVRAWASKDSKSAMGVLSLPVGRVSGGSPAWPDHGQGGR